MANRNLLRKQEGIMIKNALKITAGMATITAASLAASNAFIVGTQHSRQFPSNLAGLTNEIASNGCFDCIIVLGARVYDNGSVSLMLARRLEAAIAAYQAGATKIIIMSGANTHISNWETNRMRDYALRRGIPKEAIVCDGAGFNTYASMKFANNNCVGGRILIASQPFHLPRAIMCARTMGLDAWGIEAKYGQVKHRIKSNARELFARPKDLIKTNLPR